MPNKNYFAQLSPKQKAELFLIYTSNGMYNLNEITNHYNSEMDRAYSSTEKDMVARMHDVNAPYLLDEEGNKMTHMMASGEGYVFPTIQRNDNGDLEDYGNTEDWGAQRAINRGDTLQFKLPTLADYFSENYKTHLDNPNMFDMGGDFRNFFKNLFKKKSDEENNTPQYLDYWDAKDYLSDSFFTKKSGKYNIESVGDYGDTHFDVVSARYKGLINAMNNNGFNEEEISRLLPFLVTQNVLEGGYRVSRSDNNFGGIMMPGTSKKRVFDTEDDFYNYYLRNLDEKWGDDVLGKGRGWRNAKTIKEYADIINREDLKLYSKEEYDKYNRTHRDAPAYIYTPTWENNHTGLMSDKKFGGIYPRVYGMLDILAKRMKEWENFSKTNKIYKKD